MATIRTNCRERFSADDLEFIAASIAGNAGVGDLLQDADALDAALESDRLLKSVLELPGNVPVTPHFYFYVLTRHMLSRFDRSVADYVASVLASFVGRDGATRRPQSEHELGALAESALPYISDMLVALQSASSEKEFLIRVQVGNYSLFLSGIFPQHIAHRSTYHASPPISFYEEVGSQNYRLASGHRLAHASALEETYRTIADRFSEVRQGLNQMSDRLLCFEPIGGLPE